MCMFGDAFRVLGWCMLSGANKQNRKNDYCFLESTVMRNMVMGETMSMFPSCMSKKSGCCRNARFPPMSVSWCALEFSGVLSRQRQPGNQFCWISTWTAWFMENRLTSRFVCSMLYPAAKAIYFLRMWALCFHSKPKRAHSLLDVVKECRRRSLTLTWTSLQSGAQLHGKHCRPP